MIFAPEKQRDRLKWCFEGCKNGAWGTEPDGEHDVVCIRAADFDGVSGRLNNGERTMRALDAPTYDKVVLQPGDLVIEKSGGGDKQLVGRAVLFNEASPSVCSNFLARARPSANTDSAFLNYLLLAIYNGRGTWPHIKQSTGIQNLDLPSYLNTRVTIPSIESERRIARFLDDKTVRIDALIEKKRALLDRLAEKRQALITHAVTKGLDPNAPIKDSGIDWLGEIPAHWKVKRLRYVVRLISGSTPTTTVAEYWDGDIPWISPKDMKSDVLRGSIDKVTSLAVDECGLKKFQEPNAVLVVRGMILARRVPVAVALGTYTINQDMKVMESKGLLSPRFLQMYLMSIESYLMTLVGEAGHGTKALRTDVLLDAPVLIPPPDEQGEIVLRLGRKEDVLDQAAEKLEIQINKLTEYRSSLITAAVTGQLDVEAQDRTKEAAETVPA